jgi:NitT/TauT family transport system permease protein
MKRLFTALFFFALLFGTWHWLVIQGIWGRPAPLDVWDFLQHAWNNGTLLPALGVTTQRLILGYIAGVAVGVPVGMLTARFRAMQDTIGMIGLGFQTLPSVCWVPLAMLWFESHVESAMLFVVVMGTLWSVALATHAGVQNVPPLYSRAARTMGSEGMHLWMKVIIPAALPVIIGGVKQGWAFAWRSLMAAEIYVTVTGKSGLGQLLNQGRNEKNLAQVVGVMLVIMLVGFIADRLLFRPWEIYLKRRYGQIS